MRRERNNRRSNRDRNNGGGGERSRGRSGRGRGDRHGRRHPRQSAESGNQRERISIESGDLVLIDQFMLANPQFIERMSAIIDEETTVKNDLIKDYGGKVISVTRGTYRIERDPFAYTIIVHPEGEAPHGETVMDDASESLGDINIETRCLAMLDRELLDDSSLLERYQQLWFAGQDKACRDLLRDNGGAVRYGFKRDGDDLDELVIHQIPGEDVICLWPRGIESASSPEDMPDQVEA